MMYTVYAIYNKIHNKIYIGQTEDKDKRLRQHNDSNFDKRSYTKLNKGQWKLVYQEQYRTRGEVLRREKYLKSHHGRDWLKNVMVR